MTLAELTNILQNLCHEGMANKTVIVNGKKIENFSMMKKGDTVEVNFA